MSSAGGVQDERHARDELISRPLPNELRSVGPALFGNKRTHTLPTPRRDKYMTLFSHPDLTLKDLQEQATSKAGLGPPEDEFGGVTLRSVFWRIYLDTLNISHVLSSTPRALLRQALDEKRQRYDILRRKWLISPDGRWASDCTQPDDFVGGAAGADTSRSVAWDPLNLGESNPWQTWFEQSEVRVIIDKDVERTFPDIPYFTDPFVRKILKTILFLWAIEHPDIGYRQGMHELLAVLLLVCDRDSLERRSPQGKRQSGNLAGSQYLDIPMSPLQGSYDDGRHSPSEAKMEDAMHMVLNRRYLEHDVHAMFSALMEHARQWYEWRTETVEGSLAQSRSSKVQPKKGKIIEMSEHLQGVVLKRVDPVLARRLEDVAIEGQIWGIRWIRLMFTRELPLVSALRLWDGLFAMRNQMDNLIESVCVAMLMRIRHLIIPEDYGAILTLLLRYPPGSIDLPLDPSLILRQAIKILESPAAATGAAIALENQEVLGIQPLNQAEAETPPTSTSSTFRGKRQPLGFQRGKTGGTSSPAKTYGFESFTRGLMDRAQASGIDKALLSTLSEFRKNLPELPATSSAPSFPFRSYTPEGGTPSGNAQFPNLDSLSSHLPAAHMPPRTLRDADREIAELRLAMVGMGKTMAHWIDTLEEPQLSPEAEPRQTALEGLKRLQKTLIDGATTTTNELKQWAWSQDLATTPSVSSMTSGNPLETGNVTGHSPDDIEFTAVRTTSDVEPDVYGKDETPAKDTIALPPNTFALETSPSKSSFRPAVTYLHPPSQFTRRSQLPTPQEPSSASVVVPVLHHDINTFFSPPVAPPNQESALFSTPASKQHIRPAQSVLDSNAFDKPSGTDVSLVVDPLSGLTINHEPGSGHVYGNTRLSKDPLRGLGIL